MNRLPNSALIDRNDAATFKNGLHMSRKNRTMYEILGVLPDASDSEIQTAYQRLTQKLQAERNAANGDTIDFKLKVITVAFNTLAVRRTRDAYDARLASLNAPACTTDQFSLVPLAQGVNASSLKADAMSLKAEAMSLKAEAVSLRADVIALQIDTGIETPASGVRKFANALATPAKRALAVVGTLIAIGMVLQMLFLLLANREAAKTEEKLALQEYYQRTGVRVGSRAELEAVEQVNRQEAAEKQRRETARRIQEEQQRAAEREYERFVQESQQVGDRVTAELRREEERARYEEEKRNRQLAWQQEQEKRYKEQAERQRIQDEMNRWRRPEDQRREDYRRRNDPYTNNYPYPNDDSYPDNE